MECQSIPVVSVAHTLADDTPSVSTFDARRESDRILREAAEEAMLILDAARNEAVDTVAEANRQAIRVQEDARQAGFQAGYEVGYQQAMSEAQAAAADVVAEAQGVLLQSMQQRREILSSLSVDFTEVVMTAVKQLLGRELLSGLPDIQVLVMDALASMVDSPGVEVRVHPDAYAAAVEGIPRWQFQRIGHWDVVVVPDVTIELGGFEVRSEALRVDGRLDTQLQQLESIVSSLMERRANEYVHELDA